jgi:hypothetical protein
VSYTLLTSNLTIGDGQVAITATQITAGSGDRAQRLDIKFCNTGDQEETLILTISRNGGTARRLKRVVLAANEEFKLGGLALNKTDSLLGVTTTASSIDYVVSIAAPTAAYTEETFDDSGRPKSAPYLQEQLDAALSMTPSGP